MGQQKPEKIQQEARVEPRHAGMRADVVAADLFGGFSRGRLQTWLKSGELRVNGKSVKPKDKLLGNELLSLDALIVREIADQPEDVGFSIIYEDAHLLVVDKPAGLVVHPAAGHASGTLLNGLLAYDERQAELPRAGIVHRLDRDTTGLMVVARSLEAHAGLVAQLHEKLIYREYEAVAVGVMTGGGKVDAPIGRHSHDRKRMSVTDAGKAAVTHYRVIDRFRGHTHVRLMLETGRTHQIRVHMAHIRYPLVGDPLYGGRLRLPAGIGEALRDGLQAFPRQALHARRLGLKHPFSGEELAFESSLPADMVGLLAQLHADRDVPT